MASSCSDDLWENGRGKYGPAPRQRLEAREQLSRAAPVDEDLGGAELVQLEQPSDLRPAPRRDHFPRSGCRGAVPAHRNGGSNVCAQCVRTRTPSKSAAQADLCIAAVFPLPSMIDSSAPFASKLIASVGFFA